MSRVTELRPLSSSRQPGLFTSYMSACQIIRDLETELASLEKDSEAETESAFLWKKRAEEAEVELAEYRASLERTVTDDHAKDEVHCGCCVELRVEVKRLRAELARVGDAGE